MRFAVQRDAVANAARELLSSGLVVNTAGNVSSRVDDFVVVTPSSIRYEDLAAEDIAVVSLDGDVIEGKYLPSSETPLHLSVYQAYEKVGAIVHTHSVNATAVSTLVDELPAIHYNLVMLGGEVTVSPYAPFGSAALAAGMTRDLKGRKAALMQNHGATTVGESLAEAMEHAMTLEWLCEVYLAAAQAGTPRELSQAELEDVEARFAALRQRRRDFRT